MSDERDIIEIVEARIGEKLGKMFPNRIFDPTMIFTIMNMIFEMIERCRKAREEKLVGYMKRPRRRQRHRAMLAVSRKHPDWSWSEVSASVDTAFAVGKDATDEERLEMVREVRAD